MDTFKAVYCFGSNFQIPSKDSEGNNFCKITDSTRHHQLARDVARTLGFGCILVATSDNVVKMLSERCVSNVVTTTKN